MGAMARVAIAGCSLLALAACSGGAGDAAPSTTVNLPSTVVSTTLAPSTTRAPTTTLSPQEQDEAEIKALHDRFFQMLAQADRVTKRFKGRFLGKSSPSHFFWGAYDLALTRFSGRRAPASTESSAMMREAMSHEEISVGFWPGSGSIAEPAFYAYARPEPADLPRARVRPEAAYYSRELADFILPYAAARSAPRPDDTVLEFYQSVYDGAADLARWDRAALDRPQAEWP